MGNNPLSTRLASHNQGTVTKEHLLDLAEQYNRLSWVQRSEKLFFVAERPNTDPKFARETEHYLTRHI